MNKEYDLRKYTLLPFRHKFLIFYSSHSTAFIILRSREYDKEVLNKKNLKLKKILLLLVAVKVKKTRPSFPMAELADMIFVAGKKVLLKLQKCCMCA